MPADNVRSLPRAGGWPAPRILALAGLAAVLMLAAGCAPAERSTPDEEEAVPNPSMDPVAEAYVKLVLAVGQHDDSYVDAYYGPKPLQESVVAEEASLEEIRRRAEALLAELPPVESVGDDEMTRLRREFLATQISALMAHVDQLGGKSMTFDEESKALYDAVAPSHPDEHFQEILDDLEGLLPGEGPLGERYATFTKDFIIPADRLDAVFRAAIEECKRRTLRYLELPPGESFTIEYVTDKPWSGYNWYQGGYQSLIQVNTSLPIYMDRAIDLACHEGYPGHHVYNALLEWRLTDGRGWIEFSVYPFYSPQSLIAEGSANFGIEMAFPGEERVAFEREKLYPLAGLDPDRAALYREIQEAVKRLKYAGNKAARLYLDGKIDAGEAASRLMRYSLMTKERAEQRIRFFDDFRAYVINYNLGKDLVREFVERKGGEDVARRWEIFGALLSSPRLPSGLK